MIKTFHDKAAMRRQFQAWQIIGFSKQEILKAADPQAALWQILRRKEPDKRARLLLWWVVISEFKELGQILRSDNNTRDRHRGSFTGL